MICSMTYRKLSIFFLLLIFISKGSTSYSQSSKDTIILQAIVYNGDTIPLRTYDGVLFYARYTAAQTRAREAWTRLRNAVYVTYPYAKRASIILNDINNHLQTLSSSSEKKEYIKSREKELKKEFTDPLTNLSIYQGKILMKLINRQTGNNCYDIIKEYQGGFLARTYQTVAFFFSTSLKQPYDKNGDDIEIEKIVKEVERMYGDHS